MIGQDVMLTVASALETAAIRCMLVGSFATNYYGVPRSTIDADFLIQVDELPLQRLRSSPGDLFRIDPQSRLETFTFGT